MKIEYTGNLERFSNQKSGQLVSVADPIAKTIHPMLLKHVGKDINTASVKKQIVLTFIGENGIPFVDIINYGGGRLLKLKAAIGQWFEIDSPVKEEQVNLELSNDL